MKRKRYSVEQIVAAVKQHELGTPAADIARKLGIAEQTFYRWKKEYAGLEPGQARELRQLREENAKLKKEVVWVSSWPDGGKSIHRAVASSVQRATTAQRARPHHADNGVFWTN